MRRINKITTLLLALVMVLMMSQAAMAESYDGGTYSFNGSTINNTKAAAAIDQAIAGLQPGDSMDFTFELEGKYTITYTVADPDTGIVGKVSKVYTVTE